jgi:hypothetical protein
MLEAILLAIGVVVKRHNVGIDHTRHHDDSVHSDTKSIALDSSRLYQTVDKAIGGRVVVDGRASTFRCNDSSLSCPCNDC